MKTKNIPRHIPAFIASLQVTVVALVLLCALVVWGTLYQVDHGIYAAQERFFRAWLVLIAGVLPFPGVKTIIAILSVNLLAAALKRRPVNLRTIGIFVLHLGVAVLIGGVAIASTLVQESAITLSQGKSTSESYDFTSWQMVVAVNGRDNGAAFSKIYRYDVRKLKERQRFDFAPCASGITVRKVYRNCAARFDPDSQSVIALAPRGPSAEQGRDIPGIIFSLDQPGGEGDDTLSDQFVYAGLAFPVSFAIDDDTISVSLMPRILPLPLRIELVRFEAEWHPGTSKAKSFKSRLRVFGKNVDREIVIEMNRPFRYRSLTFYQMGYEGAEGNYSSTLAIVKNPLRYMPYVASIIIVAGLFIHFFVKMMYEIIGIRSKRRET